MDSRAGCHPPLTTDHAAACWPSLHPNPVPPPHAAHCTHRCCPTKAKLPQSDDLRVHGVRMLQCCAGVSTTLRRTPAWHAQRVPRPLEGMQTTAALPPTLRHRDPCQAAPPDAAAGVPRLLPPVQLDYVAHAAPVEPAAQPQGDVPASRDPGEELQRLACGLRGMQGSQRRGSPSPCRPQWRRAC